MTRLRNLPTTFLFLALSSLAVAQAPAFFGIAFVDTQALIRAHPAGAQIQEIGAALDAELAALIEQRDGLIAKAQSGALTATEEEILQALQVTIASRREAGLAEIRAAAAPAEQAANEVIAMIAEAEGLLLVLDLNAAQGLVVFAAPTVPDITETAVAMMVELYPPAQ